MLQDEFIDISDIAMPDNLQKINFYKKQDYFEISVSLFERCNLNCTFCLEPHKDTTIDYNKILTIPKTIITQIKQSVLNYKINKLRLRLWGGEIFFDALPDEIFNIYRKFIKIFKQEINEQLPGKTVDITYLSNGVFTKYERVEKLLKDTNGMIAFSYDPCERFISDKQKNIWLETLLHFQSVTQDISVTLTKQNIMAYIAGDNYFNKIPDNICIDINYYVATSTWKDHMPTDDDIFNFYKWCINNKKYNIKVIENIFKYLIPETRCEVERYCDRKHAIQFQNGQCICDCAKKTPSIPRKLFYGEYENQITENNVTEVKNVLGLQKRGCILCEHYKYCTTLCWIAIIFNDYKIDQCPLKRIYEYITKEDIISFQKWKEAHNL